MDIKKMFCIDFWKYHNQRVKKAIDYDKELYIAWSGKEHLTKRDLKTVEWRYLRCLRKAQANCETFWGGVYRLKLKYLTERTGIWIPASIECGKGMIIAHWGRIIVNPRVKIGDDFSISSGVVIGRDIRGKRAGVPTIGNKVCIKTGAAIIGNIRIEDDVLIAPNAFVNFDVPAHSVVVGNPGVIHPKKNATEGYI